MTDTDFTTSRRHFMGALAATTASFGAPTTAFAAAKRRVAAAPVAPINRLLATFADEILTLSPENATGLGLDTGKHASLRAMLNEAGIPGREKAEIGRAHV